MAFPALASFMNDLLMASHVDPSEVVIVDDNAEISQELSASDEESPTPKPRHSECEDFLTKAPLTPLPLFQSEKRSKQYFIDSNLVSRRKNINNKEP
jgi:hypothetical protein